MAQQWELFSHKADMGIRGKGKTWAEAFEQAGLALTGVLTDPTRINLDFHVLLSCSAPKIDTLFYDWINEIIYTMAYHDAIFGKFRVKIAQDAAGQIVLEGEAWGEKIDEKKHQPAVEIKGATFTELKVDVNQRGEYIAQCVVDV